MQIAAVKTNKGSEQSVAKLLNEKGSKDIASIIAPEEITGYFFVECKSKEEIRRIIDDIHNARDVLESNATMAEIDKFLEAKNDVKGIDTDDFVEITDGPFKGNKAFIKEVNMREETVTVEMSDATVPIPVTLNGYQIRVLDRDNE
jgi:transcriptional antiterminator NusG